MNCIITGKIVFLPVEVKNRGWDAGLLLAEHFIRAGFHVCIGMMWTLDEFAKQSKGSIYIGKDFYKYRIPFFKELKNNDIILWGWDAEGLLYENDETYIDLQLNFDCISLFDMVITWGERQKNTINNFMNFSVNALSLGNPRIDLTRKNIYEKFYKEQLEVIGATYGENYILINSNFNVATRDDYDLIQATVSVNSAKNISRVQAYADYSLELFPLFLKLIKRLSIEFPDKHIILRPHPAERQETWKDLLKDCKNVFVDKRFSVNPWLVSASFIIHSGCTTALEGILMNKFVVAYKPNISSKYPDVLPDKISNIVTNEDELIKIAKDLLSTKLHEAKISENNQSLLDYYISHSSEMSCSEQIVNEALKLNLSGSFSFSNPVLKTLKKKIKKDGQKDFNVEFGHVTFDDFKKEFEKINYTPVKLYELSENVFFILNKNSHNYKYDMLNSIKDELREIKSIVKKTVFYGPLKFAKNLACMPIRKYRHYRDEILKNVEIEKLKSIMNGNKDNINYEDELKSRIVKILTHAYSTVPYWHQFKQIENVNVHNAFEILESLPLLDKNKIIENGSDMWKIGKNIDNSDIGYTGGTTGNPLKFIRGFAAEETHQTALYEFMTGLSYVNNLKKEGKIVSFDGTRLSDDELKNKVFWRDRDGGIYGSYSFSSVYMIDENMSYYINKLNLLKPHVFRGYSNAILSLASYISKFGGLEFSPVAIYVTSEYCSKQSMIFISDTFNCPVYGQYGQSEACIFAWTNPNDDIYYCSPFYGYVEILDNTGKHVDIGETGEVVVTAFGNENQPFIRYKTGDIVEFGGNKNGVVVISKLIGRNNDYLIDNNENKIFLSGYIDIHYLACGKKIKSYQIEQNIIGSVVFRLVISSDWEKCDEEEIRYLLSTRGFSVSFEYVDSILLTDRGKQKLVIQNL